MRLFMGCSLQASVTHHATDGWVVPECRRVAGRFEWTLAARSGHTVQPGVIREFLTHHVLDSYPRLSKVENG